MNISILTGRMTDDAKIKTIQGEKPFDVADFSIAVNKYAGKDKKDKVSFFNCVASGHSAHFLRDYCGKGDKILIHGELEQQTWEKDGQKREKVVIRVNSVEPVSLKKKTVEDKSDNTEIPF